MYVSEYFFQYYYISAYQQHIYNLVYLYSKLCEGGVATETIHRLPVLQRRCGQVQRLYDNELVSG